MTAPKRPPLLDVKLLRKINADRALASVLLFSHRHPQEEAPMHIEMMDLLCAQDEFIVLEAFREAGKTTKAEEHMILAGCFANYNYMLLIGETYEKAVQRLASIDHECTSNVRLQHIFGGRVLARKSIENKLWFRSGTFIQALGWEQELQSFKHHAHRPDFAYLDDVENLERVRDKAAVDVSMEKLYRDLIPAMDKERRKIVLSQTRRAEDCMVTRLAANDDWLYRGYPICSSDADDPDAVATWPQRYPMDWIRTEKRRFQQSGMLAAFLQSYMLQATNLDAKPFKSGMFEAMDLSPWHWMPRYAIYDPSRSTNTRRTKEKDQSDRTGKVVVSRMGSKILVHESSGHYWRPNELMDDLFAVNEAHGPALIGIEKNSLDDWLLQPIRMEMLRRGVVLPLKMLQAPQDRNKEQFIMGLQPFFEAGDIVLVGGVSAHPVAMVRDGRRLLVAGDWSVAGALSDAVKTLVFGVRTAFPRAALQAWVPADIFDQWQRVSLVPALRAERLTPYRGEHCGVARGCLSERIRTTWHNHRMLVVDRKARLTLNALSAGYALAAERGGRTASEPEAGVSRLIAEALECMVAVLDRTADQDEAGFPKGSHLAVSPSGAQFVTANPRAR